MFSMFYLLYKIFRNEQVPFKALFKNFLCFKSFLEWILAFQTIRDPQKNLKILKYLVIKILRDHVIKIQGVTEIQNHYLQRIMTARGAHEDAVKMKYLQTLGQLLEVKVEQLFSVLMMVRLFVKFFSIELFIGSILKDFF